MLDAYTILKTVSKKNNLKTRFKFIAIRNTKLIEEEKPMLGMVESLAPAITFSNIWSNNSNEAMSNGEKLLTANHDEFYVLSLQRDDNENIPLGWYLSSDARTNLNRQVAAIPDSLIYAILK